MPENTHYSPESERERMRRGINNKIPFGLKGGLLVEVSDVESGLGCGCVCPSCHRKLQANKGKVASHYFSHDPSLETSLCESAFETSIHLMAKQILSEEGTAAFPPLTVKMSLPDSNGMIHTEEEVVEPPSLKIFSEVELEKRLEDIRPDIIAYVEDEPLLVEVAVTHFTEPHKKTRIRALGLPAIEIDLSTVSYTTTKNELRKLVVKDSNRKKWLSNPKAVDIKKTLREKLEERIRLANEDIEKRQRLRPHKHAQKTPWTQSKSFVPACIPKPPPRAYPERWFVCEACRFYFKVSQNDIPLDADTIPCPDCDHAVSTRPSAG